MVMTMDSGRRDRTLTQLGEAASPMLGLLSHVPERLREHVATQLADGIEHAEKLRAAGEPLESNLTDDTGQAARDALLAERRRLRAVALQKALPDGRAAVALRGLACLDADQHPRELAEWLADPNLLTMILAGTTGTGKTMAAYATAAEAAVGRGAAMRSRRGDAEVRQLVVRAWTVNGYLAELRPDGSPEPVWRIRDLSRMAELLILDDLGAETDAETTEFVRRELVELLEYRLEQRLRTIITTNLRSGMIEDRFGPRLMSRLVDRATALRFVGDDRRNLRKLTW